MKKFFCFLPYFSFGGAERTAINLCNYLTDNYEVYIIVLNTKNFPHHNLNKNINLISLKKKRLISSIFSLSYYLYKIKPHYFISFLYSTNVISIISKIISLSTTKLIFGVQNNYFQTLKNANSLKTSISLYLFKYSTLFCEKIITCSIGLKYEIKKISYKPNKVYHVYNPIIDKNFYSQSYKFDKDLNLFNTKKIKILSICRFEKQKNVKFLISSFKKLNVNNKFKLFLIGNGSLLAELKSLCTKLKLNNSVFFLGNKKNVNIFLKKSDYFILSSNWEGFGNVLVEALYFNNKVISSNCKFGPEEILKNGKLGKLFKINSSIKFNYQFSKFYYKKPIFKHDLKQYYALEVAQNYKKIIES